jgi:xanthosine utilization system XapX-like protein
LHYTFHRELILTLYSVFELSSLPVAAPPLVAVVTLAGVAVAVVVLATVGKIFVNPCINYE